MKGENDNLGAVYTLDEAAAHLRLTNRAVAKIARRNGLCMVAGRNLLFTDGDIEKIKDVAESQPLIDANALSARARRVGFRLREFMRTPKPQTGETIAETSVYVLKCGRFVKIGVAKDVSKRMATLQIANPYSLDLVHSEALRSLTYAGIAERAAHATLDANRIRSEWFTTKPAKAAKVVSVAVEATRNLCLLHDKEKAAA